MTILLPSTPVRDVDSSEQARKLIRGDFGFLGSLSRGLINRGLFRDNLDTTTWLTLGAVIQCGILALVPKTAAMLPALLLLGYRFAVTLLQTFGLMHNVNMDGVVLEKTAAMLPRDDGSESKPAERKVAVLMLGARSNHPLGMFAPGYKTLADYADVMYADLDANRGTNGFLGMSEWINQSRNSSNEIMTLQYWDSIESIHAFAHRPVHTAGWQWWNATMEKHNHIGIKHEVFEVPVHAWEGVYDNYHPTGLGAVKFPIKNSKEEEGVKFAESTLVDARRGVWKSSMGRLGQNPKLEEYSTYAPDAYDSGEE